MKKRVWIINHYAGDTFFDKGGRHFGLSKYLKRNGYEPVIFCCSVKHNPGTEDWFEFDGLWKEEIEPNIEVPYVFVKSRHYVGNGKSRILNMIDFYKNVKKTILEYCEIKGKPDIIIASSVHPLSLVAGIQLAKKLNVKCICEIRDLWPESIVDYGIAKKNNPIVLMLRRLEKWIYIHADNVIFTMEGGYDYIKEQKWDKIIPESKVKFVNNGVDLEVFNQNLDQYSIVDDDLNSDCIKVIYTGSIRRVNNVGKILDIAKNINNKNIKFLIWGDGDELESLKKRVIDESLDNVVFKGRVEKKYIPYITHMADINFAHNDSSKLFRFGISFNKVFDYLAAGAPILCDFYSKYNPVISVGAGVSVDSGDCVEIARTIDALCLGDNEKISIYKENAHKGATKYDYANLALKLIDIIENV